MPQRHVFDRLQRIYKIYFEPRVAALKWLNLAGRLPAKVSLQKNWTLRGGPYRPLEVQEIEIRRAMFNFTEEAWDAHWRTILEIDLIARPTVRTRTVKMVSLEDVTYLLPPADKLMRLCKAIRESMGEPHARPH
jgi:hypothetical protein